MTRNNDYNTYLDWPLVPSRRVDRLGNLILTTYIVIYNTSHIKVIAPT